MKAFSPNCYNFKKLSVLAQTISLLYHTTVHVLHMFFFTIFTDVQNIQVSFILWYTHPVKAGLCYCCH